MSYLLDILMLILLVFEMMFFYLPPVLHEAVGVALLLPILWHLVLNRRYVSSLGRGRWNGARGVRFALNVLLASACLVTVISGCLTSSVLFADVVPFSLRSNPSLYQLHSAAARYFVVLAGLHLGWHLPTWWQRWLHAAGITSRPLPQGCSCWGSACCSARAASTLRSRTSSSSACRARISLWRQRSRTAVLATR